jgi:hypothetical protein
MRHIVWGLAAFNAAMCLAFLVTGSAQGQTMFVTCCIDATADNTFPAPGMCFAPAVFAKCVDSPAPGAVPCTGVFTGTAIPASVSMTKGDSAEGCAIVNGNINVMQVTRGCTGHGPSGCACATVMVGGVAVATKVASGLICP